MPECRIKLSEKERNEIFFLILDGSEQEKLRPKSKALRKRDYSGKKKRFTKFHQIITDDKGTILCVWKAKEGRQHDKRIYDDSRVVKAPGIKVLADLGYLGTQCETPVRKQKNKTLSRDDKAYNRWFISMRIAVEHAIGRMKKFDIFSDVNRGNRHHNMITKNRAALANMNLKIL